MISLFRFYSRSDVYKFTALHTWNMMEFVKKKVAAKIASNTKKRDISWMEVKFNLIMLNTSALFVSLSLWLCAEDGNG